MKYLKISFFLITTTLISCSVHSDFQRFSKKIEMVDRQNNRVSSLKKSVFIKGRTATFKRVSFLEKKITDTLFVLETYIFETGTVFGEIWDDKNNVSYEYRKVHNGERMEILNKSPFTNFQKFLVHKWDTLTIRKEENDKANLSAKNLIRAHRCYKIGEITTVDEIYFKDFFSPNRDN